MDHRKEAGRQGQELTGPLKLRPARAGEADALSALALRSKAHWGYDGAFMAACVGELTWAETDIDAGRIWVVETAAKEVVGFCDLRLAADRLEVDALYVDPDAMGQGAGAMLWRKAEQVAAGLMVCTIALDADPHAVGFYERMGARVAGQAPSGSIPGRVLPRMVKELKSLSR